MVSCTRAVEQAPLDEAPRVVHRVGRVGEHARRAAGRPPAHRAASVAVPVRRARSRPRSQADRDEHLVDHLEAGLDPVRGVPLPELAAAGEHAARLVAELGPQRILGERDDAIPESRDEPAVAGPFDVLAR